MIQTVETPLSILLNEELARFHSRAGGDSVRALSSKERADFLKVSPGQLSSICSGKERLTPQMAVRWTSALSANSSNAEQHAIYTRLIEAAYETCWILKTPLHKHQTMQGRMALGTLLYQLSGPQGLLILYIFSGERDTEIIRLAPKFARPLLKGMHLAIVQTVPHCHDESSASKQSHALEARVDHTAKLLLKEIRLAIHAVASNATINTNAQERCVLYAHPVEGAWKLSMGQQWVATHPSLTDSNRTMSQVWEQLSHTPTFVQHSHHTAALHRMELSTWLLEAWEATYKLPRNEFSLR